ncbi:metal-sensitive transcriptional regulator, partial [Methylobacterium variabile]
RIEGQVRGLQQMIENGRYCVDVSHQTDAVIAALRRVQSDMLRDHMQALVQAVIAGDLPEAERRRLADEMSRLVAKVV